MDPTVPIQETEEKTVAEKVSNVNGKDEMKESPVEQPAESSSSSSSSSTKVQEIVEEPPKKDGDEGEDSVITFNELLEEMDQREETKEVLLGAQDETVCTYPEGYKPRQPLFACLTCTPEPVQAGVCYGCAMNCHEDHDIVELYTKRSFKCDCGNSKFGEKKCQLYEEKSRINEYNLYNHNFNGRFCKCDDTYPSETNQEDMLQCEFCEDWFHQSHINMKECDIPKTEDPETNPVSLVCPDCVKKLPFLNNFEITNLDVVCHSKNKKEIDENAEPKAVMIETLRSRVCRCEDCKRMYDSLGCEFLLDEEDDLSKFEQEGKQKAQENRTSESDDMRGLVKEVGMEGAINFMGAVTNLKRKLRDWMEEAGNENKVVKEEDVRKFFSDLKEEENEVKRSRMMK